MRPAWMAAAAAPAALTVLLGAGFSAQDDTQASLASVGVDPAAIPAEARALLPFLQQTLTNSCPDLPALWVVAETQAESGWDPHAFSPVGAAGLLQLMPGTWVEAGGDGGTWPTTAPPPDGHPVWEPHTHLTVAIGWMCANLHLIQQHLRRTGKPIEALDALAVCHIAGCSRVTRSATGLPRPGEAGCGADCVRQITHYLAAIHHWAKAYAAPVAPAATGTPPAAYPGWDTGCSLPDPTGTGGCVTGATAWLLAQVAAHIHQGPVSCWDAHAWNPTSDHPKGRACDYRIGRLGHFPGPADTTRGWALAQWLRAYAAPLHVSYVIWQGRIWSVARDAEGWRPYSGGGIYDPTDPTGGHFDHVHVSLNE